VDAVAEQFAAAGVGRGDVVAVMLPNRVELMIALLAAWRLGAAATPVNPVFTPNEAGYQIDAPMFVKASFGFGFRS
jgi:acyl-CoA synthetase (AMP-forming)/AMP-acid ligase II